MNRLLTLIFSVLAVVMLFLHGLRIFRRYRAPCLNIWLLNQNGH